MSYKTIKCQNCGNNFIWSEEEQTLYKERKLSEPIFCPICRGIMDARNRDINRTKIEKGQK